MPFPGSCFNYFFSVETKFPFMSMLNPKSLQFVFHCVGITFFFSLKFDCNETLEYYSNIQNRRCVSHGSKSSAKLTILLVKLNPYSSLIKIAKK